MALHGRVLFLDMAVETQPLSFLLASISRSWRNPPCRFFMHRTAGWTNCFRLLPRRSNKLFLEPYFLRSRLSGAMAIDGPPFRKSCRSSVTPYGTKNRNSSSSEYGGNDAHFDFCGYRGYQRGYKPGADEPRVWRVRAGAAAHDMRSQCYRQRCVGRRSYRDMGG